MAGCKYKTRVLGEEWKCPLDALPREEYCYWHKEVDGKEPTGGQLEELREKEILNVYLKEAKLAGANLQGAHLLQTNLQKADLMRANLEESNLIGVNLKNAYLQMVNLKKSNLIEVNLQKSNLMSANLQEAKLSFTDIENAYLFDVKLQKSYLIGVNLQESNLMFANIRKTNTLEINLQEANLMNANLQETNLMRANLQGAYLHSARFDSKTNLDNSILIGANLYRSYFDEAKSFRNATVFQNEGDKEINEIVGDFIDGWFVWILERIPKYMVNIITKVLKKKPNRYPHLTPYVLDVGTIEKNTSGVAKNLQGKDLIRYAPEGHKIIFFDWQSGCAIKNPENGLRHKDNLNRVEELTNLLLEDGRIQSEFLYGGSRANLYEASYEVYNNLYNFYIANGRLDQAAHVHYRRGEAHRKLRWARGGFKNKARSIFDLLILRTLTGYGDWISRPIFVSGLIIGLFAFLFWHFDGIVKNVNGTQVAPNWVDYTYHSITTFTSLGYSNIQPNLAVGHLPQVLVAFESGLGVLMMAIIIFVVTYQVSR